MEEQNVQTNEYADQDELLSNYVDTLNPAIQNLITSDQITTLINSIANELNLSEEEVEIFGNEVTLALLGFGNPIHFAENLIQEGVSSEKASLLASTAESKIFSQVKSEIEELYTEKTVSPQQAPEAPIPAVEVAEPIIETRPAEPFIKTQDAQREPESVHTIDREALLRELESPEPFNVPFVPRKISFEEKILHPETSPEPVASPAQTTPSLETKTPPISHDHYREKPTP